MRNTLTTLVANVAENKKKTNSIKNKFKALQRKLSGHNISPYDENEETNKVIKNEINNSKLEKINSSDTKLNKIVDTDHSKDYRNNKVDSVLPEENISSYEKSNSGKPEKIVTCNSESPKSYINSNENLKCHGEYIDGKVLCIHMTEEKDSMSFGKDCEITTNGNNLTLYPISFESSLNRFPAELLKELDLISNNDKLYTDEPNLIKVERIFRKISTTDEIHIKDFIDLEKLEIVRICECDEPENEIAQNIIFDITNNDASKNVENFEKVNKLNPICHFSNCRNVDPSHFLVQNFEKSILRIQLINFENNEVECKFISNFDQCKRIFGEERKQCAELNNVIPSKDCASIECNLEDSIVQIETKKKSHDYEMLQNNLNIEYLRNVKAAETEIKNLKLELKKALFDLKNLNDVNNFSLDTVDKKDQVEIQKTDIHYSSIRLEKENKPHQEVFFNQLDVSNDEVTINSSNSTKVTLKEMSFEPNSFFNREGNLLIDENKISENNIYHTNDVQLNLLLKKIRDLEMIVYQKNEDYNLVSSDLHLQVQNLTTLQQSHKFLQDLNTNLDQKLLDKSIEFSKYATSCENALIEKDSYIKDLTYDFRLREKDFTKKISGLREKNATLAKDSIMQKKIEDVNKKNFCFSLEEAKLMMNNLNITLELEKQNSLSLKKENDVLRQMNETKCSEIEFLSKQREKNSLLLKENTLLKCKIMEVLDSKNKIVNNLREQKSLFVSSNLKLEKCEAELKHQKNLNFKLNVELEIRNKELERLYINSSKSFIGF